MTERYANFEELRPTGEASHIPDERVNDGSDGEPRRQRIATTTGGYPDEPLDAGGECRSCSASIPTGQTKCRFCLTNHIGNEAASTDETVDTTLLGIVHMVVESTTFYAAVAKGSTAARFLTGNETESAVDDTTLIYDLNGKPAPQLADRWPSLPDAVQVDSAEGEKLLTAAREHERGAAGQQPSARLYDQRGNGIRDESRLTEVLNDADDAVWLVPAMALTETAGEGKPENQRPPGPATEYLDCQNCGQPTDHRFKMGESVPDDTWTGQPIWECQMCGSARYGPSLE